MLKSLHLRLFSVLMLTLFGVSSVWAAPAGAITDYTNITSGQKYYIGATTGATDFYLSLPQETIGTGVSGTATTDKAAATIFTFEGSGNSWYVKLSSGNYLTLSSTKANGKVNIVNEGVAWTLSNESDLIKMMSNNTYALQKNNTGTQFGSYGSTQTNVWLLPAGAALTNPEISFGLNPDCSFYYGATYTFPTLENAHNLTVSYSISCTPDGVATIDPSTGLLTVNTEEIYGSATVTASWEQQTISDVTYSEGSASYTFRILDPDVARLRYSKISTAGELEVGKKYILVCESKNKAMGDVGITKSNKGTPISITIDNNIVTLDEVDATDCVYEIEITEGSTSGSYYLGINGQKLKTTTGNTNISLDDTGNEHTISFDGDGNVVIYVTDGRLLSYNESNVVFGNYSTATSNVQLYKKLETVKVKISDAGYGTLYYSDKYLIVPEGIEARTYKVVGNTLSVSKTINSDEVIPAGEGVVLKGTPANYYFHILPSSSSVKDVQNMLLGSDVAAETTGGAKYYKLSLNAENAAGTVGFYWGAENGAAFTSAAHKAYLAIPAGGGASSAPSFFLFEDNATAINGVENAQNGQSGKCYNLAGQKVSSDFRGIVIVNGKKVVK